MYLKIAGLLALLLISVGAFAESMPQVSVTLAQSKQRAQIAASDKIRLQFSGNWPRLVFVKASSYSVIDQFENIKATTGFFNPNFFFCLGFSGANDARAPELFFSAKDPGEDGHSYTWLDLLKSKDVVVDVSSFSKAGSRYYLTFSTENSMRAEVEVESPLYQKQILSCRLPVVEVTVTVGDFAP